MSKDARFGSSSERDDVLDAFEEKMEKLMVKAIRAKLEAQGISHYFRDGAVVITQKHREDEIWAHHFKINTIAVHK